MKRKLALPATLAALLAALQISACSDDRSAGAEDFPNSLQALGPEIANGLARSGSVSGPSTRSVDPQSDPVGTLFPSNATAKRALVALGKLSAATGPTLWATNLAFPAPAAPVTTINLSDTANGTATAVTSSSGIGWTRLDSAIIRWDTRSRDAIADNENALYYSTTTTWNDSTWRSERAIPTHATSGLNPAPDSLLIEGPDAPCARKLLWLRSARLGRLTSNGRVLLDPGPDCKVNPDTDNRLIEADDWTTFNGAALDSTTYRDADADGQLLGRDSALVDLTEWHRTLFGDPSDLRITELRMATFPSDSTRNQAVAYRQRELAAGTIRLLSTFGPDSTDQLVPGQSITLIEEHRRASDSLALDRAELEATLGLHTGDPTPISRATITLWPLLGDYAELKLVATPDASFASGAEFTTGTLTVIATDASGNETSLELTVTADAMQGTAHLPDGREFPVDWDRSGNPR
jgi:hypothetical protein